ncbi:energy-coupling factor transporter transmembrane protein EcfT [Rossellomorea vietnamensis]|uniref:Energy-coupling factor transporter transmembrane protein EcfT n=1 Tax=Rossellomorea vietnamensis TaxID=218284 RepID=A0A5D4M8T0_9BACI|nr:energy-coupling factor transporter transmembrane protein EcfT [Rossellomorea vietnamensis]TYR97445.1 energy-coupling factor transporter transmembrane protein EcfT [Rossellomorea vietnamensis]
MMEKMIFGRYIPSDSFVHRMDPRSKLIFVFAFICIVFLADNAVTYAVMGAFTLGAMLSVKVPLKFLLGGLKPVMWLVLFTFLLHIFFTKEGDVLADLGIITIYEEGLRQAVFISLRFTYLIIVTTLLTLTTSPISITDGLETLLNPLKKVRFPVHEMALMMSISLRFIPTLMEETDKIIKAQTARGAELATGPIKERIKSIVPLLIPLFVSAFKRAEDLATAMEARGYKGGEGRTKYRVLNWTVTDTAVLGSLVILAAVLIVLRG